MSRIWIPGSIGGSADLDLITAAAGDVLKNAVIIDKDGNPLIGTLELTGNVADSQVLAGRTYYNTDAKTKRTGSMPNQGAKTAALNCGGSYTIPAGYHNGAGKVTANSLASQTSANAAAGEILSGKTAFVNGNKITGSMPNQGAKTATLSCGGSYTIPAGYHNGVGKVTANSLASQTSANAAAGEILSGKTAFVNGNKVTGSMPNKGTLNWSGSNTTYSVPAGYYSGGTLDSRPSYNAGVAAADNRTNTNSANYKAGYNAGVAAGKSTQYNAASLSKVTGGNAQSLSFSATAGIYIAAMAGDPGHYEQFSVSGATVVSNIGEGDNIPPNGSRFGRIILLKVTSNTTVTINWGAPTKYAIVTRLS